MAIAFGAVSAKTDATGSSTVAATYPSGVAAGHLALAVRNMMSGVNTITFLDEAGWAELADFVGGTGNQADNHNSRLRVGSQVLTGSESGTVTFDASGNCSSMAMMARYSNGTGTWDVVSTNGDDATHGANRSATGGAALDIATGDVVVAVVSVDTDAALTITSPSITASGITFGTVTRRTSGAGSTAGIDGNIEIFDATVTAGSGTVTPSFSMTTATSQCGPVALIRLRETSSGTNYDKAPAEAVGATDTATREVAAVRAQGDPVGATDAASRDVAAARTQGDTVGVTDSATAVLSVVHTKAPADPVSATDAASATTAASRGPADPVGVTDSVDAVKTGAGAQAPEDNVGVSDTVIAQLDRVVTVADFLALTDATTTPTAFVRTVGDPVGLTDAPGTVLEHVITVDDMLGLLDTAEALAGSDVERTVTLVGALPPELTASLLPEKHTASLLPETTTARRLDPPITATPLPNQATARRQT